MIRWTDEEITQSGPTGSLHTRGPWGSVSTSPLEPPDWAGRDWVTTSYDAGAELEEIRSTGRAAALETHDAAADHLRALYEQRVHTAAAGTTGGLPC